MPHAHENPVTMGKYSYSARRLRITYGWMKIFRTYRQDVSSMSGQEQRIE